MVIRISFVAGLAAFALAFPAATSAQTQVTWAEAVDYVMEHGSPAQFYGPVAKSLGLSNGTPVDYRVLSKAGSPKREFCVTADAVVLFATWKSGASRGYTASRTGSLQQAVERNTIIPIAQANAGFAAEKNWWVATIAAEKAKPAK